MARKINPLKELAKIARQKQERPILIAMARLDGESWADIAAAAQMSRQGVTNLYHEGMVGVQKVYGEGQKP